MILSLQCEYSVQKNMQKSDIYNADFFMVNIPYQSFWWQLKTTVVFVLSAFKRKPENYLLNKMIAVRELCSLHELHAYLW